MSKNIQQNLNQTGFFDVISDKEGIPIDEDTARKQVLQGEYLMAIVLPSHLSTDLERKVQLNVQQIIHSLTEEETYVPNDSIISKEIRLYFDPTVQISFKENIKNVINKMIYQIENEFIYKAFQKELNTKNSLGQQSQFITFTEINPKTIDKRIIPNSVQHNVPAWALFAIFFIVIPLSANIVKERTQGTALRLFTSPISLDWQLANSPLTPCRTYQSMSRSSDAQSISQ